ncbi:inositol monophosphatase family protein [Thiohalobacter sp.]|uniref:inositol monophosphatase family protein n=1 Tax=Thiohalobacter sp. TaxID=2025948 RepID=UPI00260EDE8F|nr:inositol monophosphatase [Thiohalobacter sp.]
MPLPDPTTLAELVRRAAREELMPRFERVRRSFKADGSVLTEADLAMDRRLQQALARDWPEIGFLSEEMGTDEQTALLAEGRPLWCLDPLDGTSNFAAGIPFFGVSLALIEAGQPVVGVIHDPVRDESVYASRGNGCFRNGERLQLEPRDTPLSKAIALVDFKRLKPALRRACAERPPWHSQRNFGSCALEWAWLAAGRGDVYLHGGQKLWDFAAGTLLLEEAGGFSATLEGDPVFRADMAPRPVVASPDAELFAAWQAWLRAAG